MPSSRDKDRATIDFAIDANDPMKTLIQVRCSCGFKSRWFEDDLQRAEASAHMHSIRKHGHEPNYPSHASTSEDCMI